MGSFGQGCDIKYIALLHPSGCWNRRAMSMQASYTTEALVSLCSVFYYTCLPFEQVEGVIFGSHLESKPFLI